MSNKLVIFDLDGVLLSSREIHFEALNRALQTHNPSFIISWEEHLAKYDGLPTTKKLQLLCEEKGVPRYLHDAIWSEKQKHTTELYKQIASNEYLQSLFKELQDSDVRIAVASNSIAATMHMALRQLGLMPYIDYIASNEDVTHPKPFPEIYWRCMTEFKTLPEHTVIIEDSHIGRTAALASKAHLIPVRNPDDLTRDVILAALEYLNGKSRISVPWRNKKMKVVIPCAGMGSRFAQAGYTFPKPLIEVNGKPMIQVVVENLNIEAQYIFIVQREHYEKYQLKYMLNMIAPGCEIVLTEGLTEGAACTTLLAKEFINNDDPLLIANSDQYVEWNSNECLYAFTADGIDGGILTFKSVHPKWSYARLDDKGFVAEVAEKKPISDLATVGIYYWTKGSDYVNSAEEMIKRNIRTNGEFYVAPTINMLIEQGKRIRVKGIDRMWGLGTPSDLRHFLDNHKQIEHSVEAHGHHR